VKKKEKTVQKKIFYGTRNQMSEKQAKRKSRKKNSERCKPQQCFSTKKNGGKFISKQHAN
jgi:hypothetical protein